MNAFRMSVGASIWASTVALGAIASLQANASATPHISSNDALTSEEKASYRVSADGKSIEVILEAATVGKMRPTTCQLSAAPSRARLSFDGLSLLVTPNGFVPVRALRSCGKRPLLIRTVAEAVGMLEDVNASHRLYVGLLPVSTQPLAYLAVVGTLGSARNRVNLPGAYVNSQSDERRQQQAFSYADEAGPYAKISRDGRYVAPNGEVDCSRDAYPGIWNLATGQKVVLAGTPDSVQSSCKALFEATTAGR
jgi:hypothetical protein